MKTIIERYRISMIVLTIAGAALALALYPRLSINTDFGKYVPHQIENRKNLLKLDSIFGGNEKIVIVLQNEQGILNAASLSQLSTLTQALQNTDGVDHCLSLLDAFTIVSDDGETSFTPLMDSLPQNATEAEQLKKNIAANRMAQGLISDDFTSAAIIVSKSGNTTDQQLISQIKHATAAIGGNDDLLIAGLPYLRETVKTTIRQDLIYLLPGGILLMMIVLFLFFRDWKGVFIPFTIVLLSILFTFGLMALMRWEISMISVLLPIMMIAIANDYSIHLLNLYQEKSLSPRYNSSLELALSLYHELRKPIILTALTTIGGMLGLLLHDISPAAQLGILAAFGIGLALLMSLILVPVLLSFYPLQRHFKARRLHSGSLLDRLLNTLSHWVNDFPQRVIWIFTGITVISTAGLLLIKVDTNVESYFPAGSRVRKSINMVNNNFGGSQYVSILFSGDVMAPEMLHRMEAYTEHIAAIPQIGRVLSPATFLRELSKGLYSPDEEGYDRLPASEAEAEQLVTLLSLSGYDQHLSQIIDFNHEHARLLVSLTDGSNQTMKIVLKRLTTITAGDANLAFIAGPGLSKIQLADMVVDGQIKSLLLALFIIFVLLSLIFRSALSAFKGSLPLIMSGLILFGLMGYARIPLDMVTALLSSVMIGVGVDYTIHFMWKYRTELRHTPIVSHAITRTMSTTGKGIVFNALSVIIGFSVLLFSGFAPLRYFGLLLILSISTCLFSALLLIPSLYQLGARKDLNLVILPQK